MLDLVGPSKTHAAAFTIQLAVLAAAVADLRAARRRLRQPDAARGAAQFLTRQAQPTETKAEYGTIDSAPIDQRRDLVEIVTIGHPASHPTPLEWSMDIWTPT